MRERKGVREKGSKWRDPDVELCICLKGKGVAKKGFMEEKMFLFSTGPKGQLSNLTMADIFIYLPWQILDLTLLPDHLSTELFEAESTWSKTHVYQVSSLWGYVLAMLETTSYSSVIFKTEHHSLRALSIFQDNARAMYGPCWNHFWPRFTFRPARAHEIFRTEQLGLRPMSMECLFLGTMPGTCWDHVWLYFKTS